MEKFIQVNNEIYSLKFGTNSLIQLRDFSKDISDQDLINLKFFLAIKHNNLKYDEAMVILNQLIDNKGQRYVELLLDEVLDLSLGENNRDFLFHIEDLYQKAVGEIGINPHIFYGMTPYEVDLAYKGYIERIQLKTNCMLIALRKAKDNQATLIELLEKPEYMEKSLEEREKVFNALGI